MGGTPASNETGTAVDSFWIPSGFLLALQELVNLPQLPSLVTGKPKNWELAVTEQLLGPPTVT